MRVAQMIETNIVMQDCLMRKHFQRQEERRQNYKELIDLEHGSDPFHWFQAYYVILNELFDSEIALAPFPRN